MIAPVITGVRCFLESRSVNPAALVELQLGLCCLFIFLLDVILFVNPSPEIDT